MRLPLTVSLGKLSLNSDELFSHTVAYCTKYMESNHTRSASTVDSVRCYPVPTLLFTGCQECFLKSHCSTPSQELCSAKVQGNWTTGCLFPPQKSLTLKPGVSAGDALETPLKLQGIPREELKHLSHTHAVSASPCAQPLSLILSRYCPQMILMQISISGPSFSIFLCSRLVLLNTLVTSNMTAEPLKCSQSESRQP